MEGAMAEAEQPNEHILRELGFVVSAAGEELHGSAAIVPEMWVPGSSVLRTSILAMWTDTMTGLLAVEPLGRRVPVTLELDVHLHEPVRAATRVHAVAYTAKAGRAVVVSTVDFTDDDGTPVAIGTGTFMAAPDPELTMPAGSWHLDVVNTAGGPLRVPLAERAGCHRREPGTAVLERTDDGLNSARTVNGGLLALVAEEAVLSAAVPGTALSTIAMRFLRPVRVGPAVAKATAHAGLGRVEVTDAGRDDALAVVATTRAVAL
jgi:acyl-coenzyme A thioesterase PaaI-like protein